MLTPSYKVDYDAFEPKGVDYPLWVTDRFSLISLWDMLKAYAHAFAQLQHALAVLSIGAANSENPPPAVSERLQRRIKHWLDVAESCCKELHLDSSCDQIDWIRRRNDWSYEFVDRSLDEFSRRIEGELKNRMFLYVPLSKLDYYDKPWFGEKVEDRFPDAVDDMREAANCFALNRWPAVLHHCMGIVDQGMKEVGNYLGCKIDVYLDDWNAIITRIEGKVKIKRDKANALGASRALKSRWRKAEPFYEGVIKDFRAMTKIWRNPTYHFRLDKRLDESKAKKVLDSVRDFMQTLSEHLPKTRRRKP